MNCLTCGQSIPEPINFLDVSELRKALREGRTSWSDYVSGQIVEVDGIYPLASVKIVNVEDSSYSDSYGDYMSDINVVIEVTQNNESATFKFTGTADSYSINTDWDYYSLVKVNPVPKTVTVWEEVH
jgi:hypothetical protein